MNLFERDRLIGNIVASMKTVPESIQKRQIQHFLKVDPAYGARVATGLGWKIKDVATPVRMTASLLTRRETGEGETR